MLAIIVAVDLTSDFHGEPGTSLHEVVARNYRAPSPGLRANYHRASECRTSPSTRTAPICSRRVLKRGYMDALI
jgi:hypothetical protein